MRRRQVSMQARVTELEQERDEALTTVESMVAMKDQMEADLFGKVCIFICED